MRSPASLGWRASARVMSTAADHRHIKKTRIGREKRPPTKPAWAASAPSMALPWRRKLRRKHLHRKATGDTEDISPHHRLPVDTAIFTASSSARSPPIFTHLRATMTRSTSSTDRRRAQGSSGSILRAPRHHPRPHQDHERARHRRKASPQDETTLSACATRIASLDSPRRIITTIYGENAVLRDARRGRVDERKRYRILL